MYLKYLENAVRTCARRIKANYLCISILYLIDRLISEITEFKMNWPGYLLNYNSVQDVFNN